MNTDFPMRAGKRLWQEMKLREALLSGQRVLEIRPDGTFEPWLDGNILMHRKIVAPATQPVFEIMATSTGANQFRDAYESPIGKGKCLVSVGRRIRMKSFLKASVLLATFRIRSDRPLKRGDRVKIKGGKSTGSIEAIRNGYAWVWPDDWDEGVNFPLEDLIRIEGG